MAGDSNDLLGGLMGGQGGSKIPGAPAASAACWT